MATNTSPGRTPSSDPPVTDMSYEQARDELVAVVARLEAGGETLEGSLALWERGEELAARCQQWLDGARARLEAARETDAGPDGAGSGDPGPDDPGPDGADVGAIDPGADGLESGAAAR